MSRRPMRLTPFAKFVLLMIIVAPLAYMGAAYYNGEDGWQKLKTLIGIEKGAPAEDDEQTISTTHTPSEGTTNGDLPSEINRIRKQLDEQDALLRKMTEQNAQLRPQIEALAEQINPKVQ